MLLHYRPCTNIKLGIKFRGRKVGREGERGRERQTESSEGTSFCPPNPEDGDSLLLPLKWTKVIRLLLAGRHQWQENKSFWWPRRERLVGEKNTQKQERLTKKQEQDSISEACIKEDLSWKWDIKWPPTLTSPEFCLADRNGILENVKFFSFLAFIPNKALKEVWVRSILLTKSLDSFWPLRTHFSFELFPRSNVSEQREEQETQVNKENQFLKDIFWQWKGI